MQQCCIAHWFIVVVVEIRLPASNLRLQFTFLRMLTRFKASKTHRPLTSTVVSTQKVTDTRFFKWCLWATSPLFLPSHFRSFSAVLVLRRTFDSPSTTFEDYHILFETHNYLLPSELSLTLLTSQKRRVVGGCTFPPTLTRPGTFKPWPEFPKEKTFCALRVTSPQVSPLWS